MTGDAEGSRAGATGATVDEESASEAPSVAGSPVRARLRRVRAAGRDLLDQEFDWSAGHATALLSTCVFAPSLLTFWVVNGVADFSTAIVIGAVATPGGLQVRLLAYVLLVPVFLLSRAAFYLAHPVHRQTVLSGACPQSRVLSLDWFSVGVLATGLPMALQDLGPWLGMNVVFLLGLFALPRVVDDRRRGRVKVAAVSVGSLLFLYAKYGGAVPGVPSPATTVGPVATLRLSDATTGLLVRVANSLLLGPPLVAALGVVLNRVVTRPEVRSIPFVRHTVPHRDPERVVVVSAVLGTVVYLVVVAAVTGEVVVVP